MKEDLAVKGFIPMSMVDWPGKICAVVFVSGCCFRCPFCHNHSLVVPQQTMANYPIREILRFLKHKKGWIDGVTVTGGEPTIYAQLPHFLGYLKDSGLKIKLDTNGYNPEMLDKLIELGLIDAVYMDIKAPLTEPHYSRLTGIQIDVSVIRRSIRTLIKSGLEIAFRTTAIPGYVEEEELQQIRDALGDVQRFLIQPFRNQETLDPSFRSIPEFDRSRFDEMRDRYEISAQRPYVARPVARAG